MDDTVRKITAEDINPRYNWGRALPAFGTMGSISRNASTTAACTGIASRARAWRWRNPISARCW